MSLYRALQKRFRYWLARRIPEADRVVLNHRNLFILPTRAGVGFVMLLALLWLVATNYENNLIFAITFLLTALFVTAIHHTHSSLSGISVAAHKSHPVFCGESCTFEIIISHNGKRLRDNLQLFYAGGELTQLDLPGPREIAEVRITAPRRGWFDPGRLTVQCSYPLGLFRVWSHVKLSSRALVYPRPLDGYTPSDATITSESGQRNSRDGSEDFVGLDRYQRGQSLHHVAWKHYAREQGLLTKYYADYQEHSLWLDWEVLLGRDTEMRLSLLCGELLRLAEMPLNYGLKLPGVVLPPARGEDHKQRALSALALFGAEPGKGSDVS